MDVGRSIRFSVPPGSNESIAVVLESLQRFTHEQRRVPVGTGVSVEFVWQRNRQRVHHVDGLVRPQIEDGRTLTANDVACVLGTRLEDIDDTVVGESIVAADFANARHGFGPVHPRRVELERPAGLAVDRFPAVACSSLTVVFAEGLSSTPNVAPGVLAGVHRAVIPRRASGFVAGVTGFIREVIGRWVWQFATARVDRRRFVQVIRVVVVVFHRRGHLQAVAFTRPHAYERTAPT